MQEKRNKTARLIRLDKLLRTQEGLTYNEILSDDQMGDISKRTLQEDLKDLETKYNAEYELNMYRGTERLWRYKDTNFSIMNKTHADMEIIRKTIEGLSLFKGDPRYDMLRFYLMNLEQGVSGSNVNFMSFDHNADAKGLEYLEEILGAITHHYPLKMCYEPFGKPKIEVNIHPYHLRQYNRRWFVFCFVEGPNEIHNYPLDRIVELKHLRKPYIESNINFDEYFDDIVGVSNYKDREVEKILIKVKRKSIDYILTKPLHGSQKILKKLSTEEHTFLQLELKVNTELVMLLFSYSDAVEVLEPVWLRKKIAEQVKMMSSMYEDAEM